MKEILMTKSLDLGCGTEPRNIFSASNVYGIDVRTDIDRNILRADLAIEPIPFPDDEFDYVTAIDFLEHIPPLLYVPHRTYPFIRLMNEIWRVLKAGGIFYSFTPAVPGKSPYEMSVFRDPTHVNFITEETFPLYFDDVNTLARMYGFIGKFEIVSQEWRGGHLITICKKVI